MFTGGRDSPRNVGVPQADDGWTSVAKGGAKNVNFDPKKFQNISKVSTNIFVLYEFKYMFIVDRTNWL